MADVRAPVVVEAPRHPARRWIGGATAAVLLVLWALGLWRVWSHTLAKPLELDWSPYAYSDDLINYAGGFVRRGLGGEILRRLGGGTATLATVNAYVFGVYLLFSLAFLRMAWRIGVAGRRPLVALVFWLAPGGPFGDAIEGDFYPRKDFLFLLFVLALAMLAQRRRGRTASIALVAAAFAGSAVLSAIHEGFLFIGALPLALVLYDRLAPGDRRRAATVASAYLAFCVLLFAAASLFKGNAATVAAIWQSIGAANRALIDYDTVPVGSVPSGGIFALQMSLLQGIELPWAYLRTGLVWYWVVGLLASAAICLYVAAERDREGLARAAVLYATLVAGTLPLYALGWDWGRWIVAANVAFFFLFDRLGRLPAPLERAGARLAPLLPALPSAIGHAAVGLFLLLFELTYRLPECCISGPSRHFVPH